LRVCLDDLTMPVTDAKEIAKLKVPELKQELAALQLPVSGKKEELVQRVSLRARGRRHTDRQGTDAVWVQLIEHYDAHAGAAPENSTAAAGTDAYVCVAPGCVHVPSDRRPARARTVRPT
jgi:hypothetical protein